MSLEHILLGLLRSPCSGYDLKRTFAEGARHFWSAELSQIYPTLKRMQRRGWLTSRREPSPKGPPRRIYRRTARGHAALRQWLLGEPVLGAERFAYLAQLSFLGELGDLERTRAFLQQLRAKLAAQQAFLTQVINSAMPDPTTLDPLTFHEHLCLQMGIASLGAKVEWCDAALELTALRHAQEKSRA